MIKLMGVNVNHAVCLSVCDRVGVCETKPPRLFMQVCFMYNYANLMSVCAQCPAMAC